MFGSKWGFPRPNNNKLEEAQPARNSFPDESFDIGNDSTIYLSKEELKGQFGKLATSGELGCKKVEIYDADKDMEEKRLSLTSLSPPSTTASSATNTESQRFWINCLKENGVLDVNLNTPSPACDSSPAHLRSLAANSPSGNRLLNNNKQSSISSPLTHNDHNTFNKAEIFVSMRDSAILPMNETEDIASILSSKLSYSPSSTAVAAAAEYTTLGGDEGHGEKTSRPGFGRIGNVPSDEDDEAQLDIGHQRSEDSLAIKPLPSDITLKTKKTTSTEDSDDSSERDKKTSRSGSISTTTSPCSLDQLLSDSAEHVPYQEHATRGDGEHGQKLLACGPSPEIPDAVDDEYLVDQLQDKLGDMSFVSTASAPVKEDKLVDTSLMTTASAPEFIDEPDAVELEDNFTWAYDVWKSKGIMKTTSPRFKHVKTQRKTKTVSSVKSKRNSTGSYGVEAKKNVKPHQLNSQSPSEELIDPESLRTPKDSYLSFGFDEDTPESASMKSARRDRLSFPLTRPSVKKLQDRKSFANVMQMWKEKSDDKPNSHFLSPEQHIPASDDRALSVEKRASVKGKYDKYDHKNAVKTRKTRQPTSQHARLLSVTSMVSTVSSYSEQAVSGSNYQTDKQSLHESDSQSVFSITENRSIMTSDSSRDGKDAGYVTRRYVRPTKDATGQPVQKRSPPVRGTRIDEQLMMPQPRRKSSGGRSKSRRSSQRRRRLSDPVSNQSRGGESDFAKATSPRDHFRRNISPPKSRTDYKAVVQTFLGQVNEQRDDTNTSGRTPPREPDSRTPPRPEAVKKEARFESIEPAVSTTTSMDSYQLQRQMDYDISHNQSCESSSSFGGSSYSWRFDSLSQNQSSESAFDSNKFPFGLDVVDEQEQSEQTKDKNSNHVSESPAKQNKRTEGLGTAIKEETGEQDSEFDSMSSPKPPLPSNRATPRPAQEVKTPATDSGDANTDDSPWTEQMIRNLEESQSTEKHLSPKETFSDRPWRSDLVFERVRQVGDQSTVMSESNETGNCNCASSVFSGNDELIEFFLPQMGMACTCYGRPSGLVNMTEPTALENILRPWQVRFLEGFGIHRGDQLVKAHHRSANALASALRQYRRKHDMTPFRTRSCGMALQIWAKTCKAYVRSIRKQLTSGTTELKVPNTLYILSSFLERMHDQTQREAAAAQTPTGATTDVDGFDPLQADI